VWPKKFGGYIDTINQKKILFMNNMEKKLTAKAHREDFFVRKTPTSQSVPNSEYLFKKSYLDHIKGSRHEEQLHRLVENIGARQKERSRKWHG
jgi:hypothetical protein